MHKLVLIFLFFIITLHCQVYEGIEIQEAHRTIDVTSHVPRHSLTLTFKNNGKESAPHVYLALRNEEAEHLAYIKVTDKNDKTLVVEQEKSSNVLYKVILSKSLQPGETQELKVKQVFTHMVTPYPKQIKQRENQKMLYVDNVYIYSPYVIKSQKTEVFVGTPIVESFTQIKPSERQGERIIYGPYKNMKPHSFEQMKIHYLNNKPVIEVTKLVRTIEISHWGNLAVEEEYDLKHAGAELKGGFSRLDYQRNPMGNAPSSFRSLIAKLPLNANGMYFRDRIGNISSSNVRVSGKQLEVEFLPRYPLFGGWKTKFKFGYNLPIEDYLRTDGSNYVLKFKFGSPFENVFIDHLIVKVIVPEGAENVKIETPFEVDSKSFGLVKTYLDTTGRTVAIVEKKNVVSEHNMFFRTKYTFSKVNILREPLWVIGFLFCFCIFVIAFFRFDLTIAKSPARIAQEKQTRILELIEQYIDKQLERNSKYSVLEKSIQRDGAEGMQQTYKNIKAERERIDQEIKKDISSVLGSLNAHDALNKVQLIEAKEREKFKKLEQIMEIKKKGKQIPKGLEDEYDKLTTEIMDVLDELKD